MAAATNGKEAVDGTGSSKDRAAGLLPHLTIRDRKAAEAIEFYKKAFGAEELMRHPTDDGRLMHAQLQDQRRLI